MFHLKQKKDMTTNKKTLFEVLKEVLPHTKEEVNIDPSDFIEMTEMDNDDFHLSESDLMGLSIGQLENLIEVFELSILDFKKETIRDWQGELNHGNYEHDWERFREDLNDLNDRAEDMDSYFEHLDNLVIIVKSFKDNQLNWCHELYTFNPGMFTTLRKTLTTQAKTLMAVDQEIHVLLSQVNAYANTLKEEQAK